MKRKDKCFSQRGSTLIMLMIFMAIISMLGTALLGLTFTNFKMKMIQGKVKTTFYSAESALEEAYALILKKVEDAVEDANDKVDDNINNNIDADYYRYDVSTDGSIIWTASGAYVDQDRLMEKIDQWFTSEYEDYIENSSDLVNHLENVTGSYIMYNNYINTTDTALSISVSPSSISFITDGSDRFCKLNVESEYTDADGINEVISRDYSIKLANYDSESSGCINPYIIKKDTDYYYTLDILDVKNITSNAITCYGDIVKEDSSTVEIVDGNVFTSSGSIEISGGDLNIYSTTNSVIEVISGEDIIVSGNYADLNINSDVFCENLLIDKSAQYSSIEIGESGSDPNKKYIVLTKDDLELNGIESSIDIYGSYYGFNYAGYVSDPTNKDRSSIIFNSEDISASANNSRLFISGEASSHDSNYINRNGVLIMGTSYLKFENSNNYQTGECVSLDGNYLAYMQGITDELITSYPTTYSSFDFITCTASGMSFNMVDEMNNSGTSLTGIEKGKLFKDISKISPEPFSINTGNGNIDIRNVIHSNGVYPTTFGDMEVTEDSNKKSFADDLYDIYEHKFYNTVIDYKSANNIVLKHDNGRFCYLNNVNTDSLDIIGPGGSGTGATDTINLSSITEQGIIITRGDVYFTGEVKMEGIVASEGNIYFKDSEDKIIKLNPDVEIIKTSESVISTSGSAINSYYKYSNLVDVSNWKNK